MKTAQINKLAFAYILSCIDSEGYNVAPKTDKEKINFLMDTFRREYCYPENLKRYGNEINTFAEWCKGLPSAFGIEFENHKILELAVSWGVLSTAASERKKGQILENYWNFISNKAFQLHKKLNNAKGPKTIDIIAKEWFDKVNGNSYFSAQVTTDYGMKSEKTYKLPLQYGYGDSYRYAAASMLNKKGFDIPENVEIGRYCREDGIICRANIQRGCKKSDVKNFGE